MVFLALLSDGFACFCPAGSFTDACLTPVEPTAACLLIFLFTACLHRK
jgi:hypothetical protein